MDTHLPPKSWFLRHFHHVFVIVCIACGCGVSWLQSAVVVAPVNISGGTPGGSAGGDLAGTYPNPTLGPAGTAGTYGDATHFPVVTTDSKGRVTAVTTNQAAGGITGLANPSATIGLSAVNGSAATAMRSDGAPALPVIMTAQKAFQSYQGGLTHAGTVTLDFDGSATVNSLTLTGSLTLAFSNLATNRTARLLILNSQGSNCVLTLPAGVHGYYTATLSNGWHMVSCEAWGTVASNVWVSTSSDGTY